MVMCASGQSWEVYSKMEVPINMFGILEAMVQANIASCAGTYSLNRRIL